LRAQGWDIDLAAHIRRGGHVLGICGGYQMLGQVVRDPDGVDGASGETEGLGFLDVETVMSPAKRLAVSDAVHVPSGTGFAGYEIHMGQTLGPDCARPFAMLGQAPDGAHSLNGRVMGTYLHGLFANDAFRASYLHMLGGQASGLRYTAELEYILDALADHMEQHLDIGGLIALAR